MSTHVLTFWPSVPPAEPRRLRPSPLVWATAVALLSPLIVLIAAASLAEGEPPRRRCGT